MAWSVGTRHTCGGPVFGQRTPGCPRCDELAAGAPARRLGYQPRTRCGCGQLCERGDRVCMSCQIRAHDCKVSGCAAVCTFGQW